MATRKTTRTAVETKTLIERRAGAGPLTRDEELVVRMRRGLGEPGDFALEQRGVEHDETRARLAMMEAALLAEMHGTGPLTEAGDVEVDESVKNRILARLQEVDD